MKYINVGKIYTAHGLKGELKVKSNFEFKDKIYVKDMNFYFGDKKELFTLNNYRKQNEFDLLTFNNIETIDKAILYRGTLLYIDRDSIELDTYLNEDLINFEVIFNDKNIGKVISIIDAGNGNEIICLENIKIPKHDNFIEKIDFDNKKIYVKNVEGLML